MLIYQKIDAQTLKTRVTFRTTMQRGFTLIELLVVVLIIGILSAVALPQYTKAVAKARAVEAITALKAVTDAQEVYFMANNEYATALADLDVEMAADGKNFTYSCLMNRTCYALPKRKGDPVFEFHLRMPTLSGSSHMLGKHWCQLANMAAEHKEKAREICKSFGPQDPEMTDGYYLIQQ